MRLYQFTDQTPPTPEVEDDAEFEAMGNQLIRSLRSIAGRLEQFVLMLDEEDTIPSHRSRAR